MFKNLFSNKNESEDPLKILSQTDLFPDMMKTFFNPLKREDVDPVEVVLTTFLHLCPSEVINRLSTLLNLERLLGSKTIWNTLEKSLENNQKLTTEETIENLFEGQGQEEQEGQEESELENIKRIKRIAEGIGALTNILDSYKDIEISNIKNLQELKTSSTLTKEYLFYLYRIGQQSYSKRWLGEVGVGVIEEAVKSNIRLRLQVLYERTLKNQAPSFIQAVQKSIQTGLQQLGNILYKNLIAKIPSAINEDLKQKAYQRVLESTEQFESIFPEFRQDWLCRLGNEYLANEQYEEATEVFQLALNLGPIYMEDAVKGFIKIFGETIKTNLPNLEKQNHTELVLDKIVEQLSNNYTLPSKTQAALKTFFYHYLMAINHPKYTAGDSHQYKLEHLISDYCLLREFRNTDTSLFSTARDMPQSSKENIVLYYETLKQKSRGKYEKEKHSPTTLFSEEKTSFKRVLNK